MRVRRIPNETEAWQVKELKKLDVSELPEPVKKAMMEGKFIGGDSWQVQTQSGWALCSDHDYLVVDTQGVIYPVSEEVFNASYEILDEEPAVG